MPHPPMDPAFAALIKQPREPLRDARIVRQSLAEARQKSEPTSQDVDLEESFVASPDSDEPPIPIRIYRPRNEAGALPGFLYLHGGGFFCGDQFSEERQCVRYAREAGCAVVCVGYRLAPEDPFPAALNDCYRVLRYLDQHGEGLHLRPGALAIGGSSAGANLAAACALLARDRNGPSLCFQMLLIPALDPRLETASSRQFVDVPDFARPEAETMWRWYLGEGPSAVSPYAAPALAEDLSRLPPAYVLCAGLDPLRDEGLLYARRLTEAGVAVELHLVPGIPHGFASVPGAVISQRLLDEQVEVLRGAFARAAGRL